MLIIKQFFLIWCLIVTTLDTTLAQTNNNIADLRSLNALRLQFKSANQSQVATNFFSNIATNKATDAILLNLSLTYIDQLQGKNLLQQGFLSTRSQSAVEQIINRSPNHWLAWYIRGINNLYWPDWFGKAIYAKEYLTQAIIIHKQLPPIERATHDFYALGYLSLGDAYALLDKPTSARQIWMEGLNFYPYITILKERLSWHESELHTRVRAMRDANKYIDTDLKFMWESMSPSFTVTLTGGTLYGPGILDDQLLAPGKLSNLYLAGTLFGSIPAFNNGAAEPNLPGEILQGKIIDGLLSDGTAANENIDVGFVKLMNGKFNLFLSAVQDGPNAGSVNFFLDKQLNWTIHDDIGIDPGFTVGVVKFYDFNFSTSPRLIPISLQAEIGAPAGIDRAGSIASGAAVPGLLGDDDFDGYLDGILNAIGRFGFDSIILPGAPFAQTRIFKSDIPITAPQAFILTVANALQHLQTATHLEERYPAQAAVLNKTYHERLELARRHAKRASLPTALQDVLLEVKNLCTTLTVLRETAPLYNLYPRDLAVNGIVATTCP